MNTERNDNRADMKEVWELASYVEEHPDNHAQRWRLAKKLYTALEYRLALEHLLILKNEGDARGNVIRFLAATFYRLCRYDEAIETLKEGLSLWPNDVELCEQLARSQAEAGHNDEALASWRVVEKFAPDHPFAAHAIKRLKSIVDREAAEKAQALQLMKVAAPGAAQRGPAAASPPAAETTCPRCGEKNRADAERCSQCNASLTQGPDFLDDVIKRAEREEPVRIPWPITAGLLLAGLFAAGVYLALHAVSRVRAAEARDLTTASVIEALDQTVLWTRVMIGGVLLIAWPIAWRYATTSANVATRVYDETLYHIGAFLALITFDLLWLPWGWLVTAGIVPTILSALIAIFALRLPRDRAVRIWLTQLGIAAAVALIIIVIRHGPGLLIEAPRIASFNRESQGHAPFEATLRTPGVLRVRWRSSGSPWLDRQINRTRLTLRPAQMEPRVFLETSEDGKRLYFEQVSKDSHQRDLASLRVGAEYVFTMDCHDPGEVLVGLTLQSLLPFTAEPARLVTPK